MVAAPISPRRIRSLGANVQVTPVRTKGTCVCSVQARPSPERTLRKPTALNPRLFIGHAPIGIGSSQQVLHQRLFRSLQKTAGSATRKIGQPVYVFQNPRHRVSSPGDRPSYCVSLPGLADAWLTAHVNPWGEAAIGGDVPFPSAVEGYASRCPMNKRHTRG